jgi:hypothetical protein
LFGQDLTERIVRAARIHGQESDPEHEVGDLQDALRLAFKYLPEDQQEQVLEELAEYNETWLVAAENEE